MAFDGIYLSTVKTQIGSLIDGRIDKIYQPSKDEIIISIRTKQGGKKILINTSSSCARVHLTENKIDNPQKPPMFCMLMRKHLIGGKLVGVRQLKSDRVLYLDFECTNELGDICKITLACELVGRHANLIIINADNNKVIDSIKRVALNDKDIRVVLPNVPYVQPEKSDRIELANINYAQFADMIENQKKNSDKELAKAIVACIDGASPLFAREVVYRFYGRVDTLLSEMQEGDLGKIYQILRTVCDRLLMQTNKYYILKDLQGNIKDICFMKINQYENLMTLDEYDDPSTALDNFFEQRDTTARMKQRGAELLKQITNTKNRIARRIANQQQEIAECENREILKQKGDLIMANLYQVKQGDIVLEAENFYDNNNIIKIDLDSKLTASQNAQKYYNQYRKAETKEKKLKELVQEGKKELEYIESTLDVFERATSEQELLALREELAQQGYIKKIKSKITIKEPKPMHFISSLGYDLYVGRNNKQNDILTLKTADKNDIWLHTKDIAGSHVIISCLGKTEPDEKTILEAAQIAAYNSKARAGSKVAVDFTKIRYVKKPNGSKPGMVIFTNNQTVYVQPSKLPEGVKEV